MQTNRTTASPFDLPVLLTTLAANLHAHQLWPEGSPDQPSVIVIGVSGGADSVALLHGLAHLAAQAEPVRQWQLHVVHLDHALRAESAADARFVAAQAAALGLPFHTQRVASDALSDGNMEQAARRARYAFLASVADRVTPADQPPIIATAHHADDQAETLLLHLVRGAGLNGLGGMRWVTELELDVTDRTVRLVRPLLNVRRAEIMDWLIAQGLDWRHDATNDDTSLARNQLRRVIMPQLEALNPQLVMTLSRTADVLAGDADRLRRLDQAQLAALIIEPEAANFTAQRVVLNVDELAALDVATQRGVLRAALDLLLPGLRDVTLTHVEQLRGGLGTDRTPGGSHPLVRDVVWTLASASGGLPRRLSLHRARVAPFSLDSPHLDEKFRPLPLRCPGQIEHDGWQLTSRIVDSHALPADWRTGVQLWRAFLDADKAGQPMLTTPENLPHGVQFAPLGMGGRHKHLGDFFTDHKIPVALRSGWPVVIDATQGEILWVCGLQPAHTAAITAATAKVLMLAWEQV